MYAACNFRHWPEALESGKSYVINKFNLTESTEETASLISEYPAMADRYKHEKSTTIDDQKIAQFDASKIPKYMRGSKM
jgi:hypothetical protein